VLKRQIDNRPTKAVTGEGGFPAGRAGSLPKSKIQPAGLSAPQVPVKTARGSLQEIMACARLLRLARHLTITGSLGAPVYFCDPHGPWQRGSNENTNGRLLPQGQAT
jgi:hypothetical protein